MRAGTAKELVREVRLSTNSESTNRHFPLDHEKDFVKLQSYWVSPCRPDMFCDVLLPMLGSRQRHALAQSAYNRTLQELGAIHPSLA
jgi:hypothetical protein